MTATPDIHHVTSADGTRIGYHVQGTGPPLVIIPGSVSIIPNWQRAVEELAPFFTCHIYDRRGHGVSDDGPEYSMSAEVADLAAVLAAAGPGARVLSHSYSGLCALQHAMTHGIDTQLLLYEPPLDLRNMVNPAQLDQYRDAVTAGDMDRAIRIALVDMAGVPQEEVALLADSPAWPVVRELAPNWMRELELLASFEFDYHRYRELPEHKLHFLAGADSHPVVKETVRQFSDLLPGSTVTEMPGLGHFAQTTAPAELARHVVAAAGLREG